MSNVDLLKDIPEREEQKGLMYPVVLRSNIKNLLDNYHDLDTRGYKSERDPRDIYGYTIEEWYKNIYNSILSSAKDVKEQLRVLLDNEDLLDESAYQVAKKLYNEERLHHKIRFFNDLSFIGDYINFHVDYDTFNKIKCEVNISLNDEVLNAKNIYNEFEKMDPSKRIDWIDERYEYIVIHMPESFSRDRESILEEMEFSKVLDHEFGGDEICTVVIDDEE